jgi:outer membrane protein assembly factor BamA
MDEEVVLRRLELRPGSRWSAERARRDERAVTGLMIFWSVRITASRFPQEGEPDAVDVHLYLEERIGWFILPQLYWTPEESWSYGVAAGHFNVARRGHSFYLSAVTGGARYLSASLRNSWNGPHHESFSIGGSVVDIRNRLLNFDERGERFHYRLGRWFGRHGRAEAAIQYRHVSGLGPAWLPPGLAGTSFEDRMVALRLTLGTDTSDPWAVPRRGRWSSITLEQCADFLGGTFSGGRVRGMAVRSLGLGPRTTLAAYSLVISQWGEIPFWRTITLGGMNSVRGFGLGNWLVDHRWEFSGEFRWYFLPMRILDLGPLGDQIVGASFTLFTDAGIGHGIRRGPGPADGRTPFLLSGGAGLYLLNALFGTLRLEVAWPEGSGPRWGLGLGTKF